MFFEQLATVLLVDLLIGGQTRTGSIEIRASLVDRQRQAAQSVRDFQCQLPCLLLRLAEGSIKGNGIVMIDMTDAGIGQLTYWKTLSFRH